MTTIQTALPNIEDDLWLTARQASDRIRSTPQWIYALAKAGQLRSDVRYGIRVFSQTDLDALHSAPDQATQAA